MRYVDERRKDYINIEGKFSVLEDKMKENDSDLKILQESLHDLDKQITFLSSTMENRLPELVKSIDCLSNKISTHNGQATERHNESIKCGSLREQNTEEITFMKANSIKWKIAILTIGFSAVVQLLIFASLWGRLTTIVDRNSIDIVSIQSKIK